MEDWSIATVQFAWFVSDPVQIDVTSIYSHILHREPDVVQKNRIPSAAMPFLASAQGASEQTSFQLTLQPNRLDFFIQGVDDAVRTSPPIVPDVYGLLDEVVPNIQSVILPKVSRVAMVLNMFSFTGSVGEANEVINRVVGHQLFDQDALDAMYQINRRRKFRSAGDEEMNRLFRMAVARFQMMNMVVGTQVAQAVPLSSEQFAANCYIDLNTVLTERHLQPGLIAPIWDELYLEAMSMSKNGLTTLKSGDVN